MIDRKRLSRTKPAGHPNVWPYEDYKAYVDLLFRAEAHMRAHGEDEIEAVTGAARDLGLPYNHWLVQELLMGTYGMFPIYGGVLYAETPEAFLRSAPRADLYDDERREWAIKLAKARGKAGGDD